MKHTNNGQCPKCKEIIEKFPNFHSGLRVWFEELQKKNPEVHVSCAGRGFLEQEACFEKGVSKARFGQSAHNYGAALDLFVLLPGSKELWPREWFYKVLAPQIPDWIEWYGKPKSKFFELPHLEIKAWKELKAQGRVALVEAFPKKKAA